MRPKLLVFRRVPGGDVIDAPPDPGIGRLTRLKRLNISARNCRLTRSVIAVFFTAAKSTSANPGPRNVLRPRLPNVPEAGCAKAAVFRNCTYLVPSGFVMMFVPAPA